LQAQASGDRVHITHFRGQGPDLSWDVEGDLRMSGEWPLRVTADLALPPMDAQPWQVQARLDGSLAQLQLDARSSGYLAGPLTAQWQGEAFLALQSLPPSLTLNDLILNLAGDLEQGMNLRATGHLPGEGGRVDLTLGGLVMTTGVSDLNLQPAVAEQPERAL